MRLVIGYGSPVRGDDGLGQVAAARLMQEQWRHEVEVIACHQLTPELVEPVGRSELVIFIDVRAACPPGQITRTVVRPSTPSGAFTHHVTPASLLRGAQELYGSCPAALLFSVSAVQFDYDLALSPQVEAALPGLLSQIRRILDADNAKMKFEEIGEEVI